MILRTVGKDHVPGKLDLALLRALARGRRWFEEMASGRVRSCAEITRRGGLEKGYLARLMRLAFVAPRIRFGHRAGNPERFYCSWQRLFEVFRY
jgi:hypothetical protein